MPLASVATLRIFVLSCIRQRLHRMRSFNGILCNAMGDDHFGMIQAILNIPLDYTHYNLIWKAIYSSHDTLCIYKTVYVVLYVILAFSPLVHMTISVFEVISI